MNEFDPFAAEWVSYARSSQYTLVEKCLKLSQILEFPDLDITEYIKKLRSFEHGLHDHISDVKNPIYLVSMLNEYMFDILEFEGNSDDYYNPRNNFLNIVIEKRTGIPITLSIIYIELAKAIGLELRPVGFPGHFLVKYSEELILDPFNRGRLLDVEDLQDILDATYGEGVEFEPEYLNDIEPEKILIRILRNLKGSYTESFSYDKAMHCINMILGLDPNSSEDIRDKGIVQSRLLQNDLALISLNKYLELAPEADDVDDVLEMIKSIKEKSSQ
jgi:regulator of sirC expression with transglutaminase-like and TPR domain